jgi:hypothetical protein
VRVGLRRYIVHQYCVKNRWDSVYFVIAGIVLLAQYLVFF